MGIAIEFDEFHRRPQNFGGSLRFDNPHFRSAETPRLAARADHEVRRLPGARGLGDDAARSRTRYRPDGRRRPGSWFV